MDHLEGLDAPPAHTPDAGSVPGLPDLPPEHADALLDLLLRTAGAGVALFDRGLRFVRVNAQIAEINRLPVAAHLGRTVREVIPAGAAQLEPLLRGVLESGAPVTDVELSGEHPPGERRHFNAGYYPLYVGGAVAGVLAVVQETTQRRRAEDALREQSAMLTLLVENIAQTFYVDDASGNTLYASPAYEEMFGRPRETLYADARSFLEPIHPDDRPRVESVLPRAVTGTLDLSYRIVRPDGTVRRIRDRMFPVAAPDGSLMRCVGIVEDVTLEHEVMETERLLADAGRALSSSLDLQVTLGRAAALLVPRFGDFCMLLLQDDAGVFTSAAWRHADREMEPVMAEAAREYHPAPGDGTLVGRALESAQPVWEQVTPDHARRVTADEDTRRYALALQPSSSVIVPLVARGQVLGVMVAAMSQATGRRHSEADYRALREVGDRAALALDNARLYQAEQRARRAAEEAAGRVERLQALTAALAGARTAEEVAHVVLERGLEVFGAYAGGVAALGDDGEWLETLATFGYPDEVVRPFARVRLDADVPIAEAARTRRAVLIGADSPYPAQGRSRARLALPLTVDQRLVGTLALSFEFSVGPDDEALAFFATVAQQCAQALDRVRLYEAEQRARAASEAAARRSAILAEASRLLSATLDAEATLDAIAHLAVPDLGDWCAVDLVADPHAGAWPPDVRRVVAAHQDPAKMEWARRLAESQPTDWSAEAGLPRVLRTGETEFYPEITDEMLVAAAKSEAHLALLREIGFSSVMIVPLVARGSTLGAITLCHTESGRRYDPADLEMAGSLARRAAAALDNARLFTAEQAARAAAEAASLAKTEFLAVMSHELRTPLNAIAGYAELLAMGIRGPVTPQQVEDLGRIQRSQRHLLGLINDVLNFARVEAGRVELHLADLPLDEALGELESLVAPQLMARDLRYRYAGADAALRVRADAEKLRQVLLNVLSNAVKFTPRGGAVTVEAHASDGAVHVRVADTGIGIPPDRLESIFEPFVQLGRNLTSRHEGTGLGLAISRDLARAMAGDLTAACGADGGSVFTLTLPRAPDTSP